MSRKLMTALVLTTILVAMVLPFSSALAQEEPVVITWFIGLGAGGQPQHVEAQNAVVEAFNASHDDIKLEHIVVENEVATDTLATLIASGDAPDIIGPVGIAGAAAFEGSFLDLDPIIEELDYDLSRWPEALVDFYRDPEQGLTGLPFATFSSFIFYNRDMFDVAGVAYPPPGVRRTLRRRRPLGCRQAARDRHAADVGCQRQQRYQPRFRFRQHRAVRVLADLVER